MSAARKLKLYSPDSAEPVAQPDLATLNARLERLTSLVEQQIGFAKPATSTPLPTFAEPPQPPDSVPQSPRYNIWDSRCQVPADSLECLPPLGRLSLRDVYQKHLASADAGRLANSTHKGHQQTTLPRWEALGTSAPKVWFADRWGQMAYRVVGEPILNPPVGWIVAEDLIRFVMAHYNGSASKTYSAGSHKSVLAQIRAWLKRLRPQASGGIGAIFVVPILDAALLPADLVKPKFVPTEDHIRKLFEVSPADLQCLLAFEWLCGLRRSDAKQLALKHFSADLDTLSFIASKTQRKRPYPKNLPLHACATEWLRWAKGSLTSPTPETRVFTALRNLKKFGVQWKALLKQAGLSDTTEDCLGRQVEKFTLKGMRRACNCLLNDQGERAGEFVLHSSSSVNDVSYSPVYDPTAEQRRLILSTPVPAWLWPPK